jgi:hypothetical protein
MLALQKRLTTLLGGRVMLKKKNIGFRVLLSFFCVGLALVFSPYLVNQLPAPLWVKNLPTIVKILGAFVFAIIVAAGSEFLKVEETTPDDLWCKLREENQKLINDRLKQSLDQDRHIPIPSVDSPGDLERPQRKAAQQSSATAATIPPAVPLHQKWGRKLRQIFQPPAILPKAIANKLPQIKIQRNLENLQTKEVTQLPPNKPIIEIFKEANGRLLILGEPGSGKTTELLKLAQALGEAAQNNPKEPIPFIFELSAWRGEPILEWMVGEIVAQYGLNPKLCREWLIFDRIVPLLDGLDELGEERAKEAIRAIDALQEDYHNQQKALVICCRVKDYENITDDNNRRIRLKGIERAVRQCELPDDQIEWYLEQRKAEHIWDEIQSNSGLMKLARNPMLLNLMPIAYPDELPDNLPQNSQDCQSRLFDDFLHRKLYPPHSITPQPLADYDPEKAKYYLAWLAASMGRQDINKRDFLIEKLQSNWLENKQQKNQYILIRRIIFWLIVQLIFALFLGLTFGLSGEVIIEMSGNVIMIIALIVWLIFALVFFLIFEMSGAIILELIIGPIFDDFDSIELVENIDISLNNLRQKIPLILYCYSVGIGLFFGLFFGLFWGPVEGLVGGLIVGVVFVLVPGLIVKLKTDIKIRKYPNQGIWETGVKSLITMGLTITLSLLILIVPQWEIGENWNLTKSLILAVFLGILSGYFFGGGDAFTKHFILRGVLCYHGRIPRNYVHFLNEASACGILKQSGGRYRFYHDKFREHLASTIQLKVESISPRKKIKLFGWSLPEIGIVLAAILLAVILTNTFGFNPDSVRAMKPLIQTSDRVFFDRLTYPRWRHPQRYQVVSFSTKNLDENFSKHFASRRILALPDERLEISSGQIILNGKPFHDNRIKLPSDFNQPFITLAIDECYVVADNPDYANFETFGAVVPLQNIRGQLVLRVYPFDRIGLIR